MIDVLATLWQSGRMSRVGAPAGMAAVALLWHASPAPAQEQDFARLVSAASEVTLAHVITGDAEVDRVAAAGLRGLSIILVRRTSVEPAEPVGVNLETDELSVFPFLYWPVTDAQPRPSAKAYEKLNRYLRAGGLILFDTRDAVTFGNGSGGSNATRLRQLATSLDVPPLEPIPHDHVLTRSFYLLQDFPGRHAGRNVWVEAAPADALQAEGMPFRNLNDNVTPVVIGGERLGGSMGNGRARTAHVSGGSRLFRRAPARDRISLRSEPDHVRPDRELQIGPGPCSGPA